MTDAALSTRRLLGWVWTDHLKRRLVALLIAVFFMAIEGGAVGALSYLVRPMFDDIKIGAARSVVIWIAVAVAGVFVLRALAGFAHRVIMARMAEGISTDLQHALLAHLMRLEIGFYQRNAPGTLIERLRGDNIVLRSLWPPIVQSLGRDVVALISLLVVAVLIDWRWTLVAVIGVPLLIGPLTLLQKRVRKTARAAREAAAVLSLQLDEAFHGVRTLQLTGSEPVATRRFRAALDRYLAIQIRSETFSAAIPAMIDLVAAMGFAGVMLYGGLQIIDGTKTLGAFMSFFTAMALVFEPLRRLGSISASWAQARASLERMRHLLDETPKLANPSLPKSIATAPLGPRLALENVSFAYDATPVLNGASLVAEAGQTTAIVGPSGAGKTTIFHLLTRMADPQSGRVTLGGLDLRDFDLGAVRQQFSVVSQDSALFDESLAANIRLGAQDLSDTALAAALAAANAADFVAALPDGVQSPAGPRGSALSGGQRQRIAIARAILRNAPILLLDEATSALDAQSEAAVTEALARLAKGRTTLVIAHRLTTIQQADKIIVMNHGQVVGQGRHDALLAQGGLYADLYRMQFKA